VKDSKKLFAILAVSNFFLFFGFSIWRAIFNNFAVEELGVRADQIGLIQAIREVPGLLGFGLGFLVLWLSEMRVMGLSILLLGVGLVISGAANGLGILILGTVVMSVGFHFFYPSNSSLVLMEVGKQEAPKMLGSLRSVSSFAAIVGTLTGAVVIVGSVIAFLNGRRHVAQRQKRKVVFRRDYWLYYVLTFLLGSRRHIFTTFAIFMLVEIHGIDVRQTATLFLVNNFINTYASAQLGRLVSRFGERARILLSKDLPFTSRDHQQRQHGPDNQPRLGPGGACAGRHLVGPSLAFSHLPGGGGHCCRFLDPRPVHPHGSRSGARCSVLSKSASTGHCQTRKGERGGRWQLPGFPLARE